MHDVRVHSRHCCKWHGCKYGPKEKCPVFLGEVEQLYLCENCEDDLTDADYHIEVVSRLPQMYELKINSLKRDFTEALKELKNEHGKPPY